LLAITRAIKKRIVIANYKVFDIIDDELNDNGDDFADNFEILS